MSDEETPVPQNTGLGGSFTAKDLRPKRERLPVPPKTKTLESPIVVSEVSGVY